MLDTYTLIFVDQSAHFVLKVLHDIQSQSLYKMKICIVLGGEGGKGWLKRTT